MGFQTFCRERFGITSWMTGAAPRTITLGMAAGGLKKWSELSQHMPSARQLPVAYGRPKPLVSVSTADFEKFTQQPGAMDLLATYGLDASAINIPPCQVYLDIETPDQEAFVSKVLVRFSPQKIINPLTSKPCIAVDGSALKDLHDNYAYCQEFHVKRDREELQRLQKIVASPAMHERIETARFYANDFNVRVGSSPKLGASSYALSLKVFAEVSRRQLSSEEYIALCHASESLACYDAEGRVVSSLKADANFMVYLYHEITNKSYEAVGSQSIAENGYPTITYFDANINQGPSLMALIKQHTHGLLHGKEAGIAVGCSARIMPRFLPNALMESDIDELVIQAGGRRFHSAVFRIIKVGMNNEGIPVDTAEKLHYYDYYMVQHDAGAGAQSVKMDRSIGQTVMVKRIMPMSFGATGEICPKPIDPKLDPENYQLAMTQTLEQLIMVSREICCYQPAGLSPKGSMEEQRWLGLNKRMTILSGRDFWGTITYQAHMPSDPSHKLLKSVESYQDFLQQGASCTYYSLRSMVKSYLGDHLFTMHDLFLKQQTVASMQKCLADALREMGPAAAEGAEAALGGGGGGGGAAAPRASLFTQAQRRLESAKRDRMANLYQMNTKIGQAYWKGELSQSLYDQANALYKKAQNLIQSSCSTAFEGLDELLASAPAELIAIVEDESSVLATAL